MPCLTLKLSRLKRRSVGSQSPPKAPWHWPGRRETLPEANAVLPRRRSIAAEILRLAFSCQGLGNWHQRFELLINLQIAVSFCPTGLFNYSTQVIHDSYCCETFPSSLPFPTRRQDSSLFVGSVYTNKSLPSPGICPQKCRPERHPDWDECWYFSWEIPCYFQTEYTSNRLDDAEFICITHN